EAGPDPQPLRGDGLESPQGMSRILGGEFAPPRLDSVCVLGVVVHVPDRRVGLRHPCQRQEGGWILPARDLVGWVLGTTPSGLEAALEAQERLLRDDRCAHDNALAATVGAARYAVLIPFVARPASTPFWLVAASPRSDQSPPVSGVESRDGTSRAV